MKKVYWQLILTGGLAKETVDKMTADELYEAYAALAVLSNRK